MNRLRLWMLILVLTPLLTCSAGSYYFRTVDVKDGMTDNMVRDIERDSYGYIWMATINGLSRYDGHRFHSYLPQQSGCRSNDVAVVREAADSTLWMMCAGELLTYDRAEDCWQKDGVDRLTALGMEGAPRLLYIDDARNLWVATDLGLFYFDYSGHKTAKIANRSGSPVVRIVARGGTAVVLTEDNRLYEVERQERRLVPIDQAPMAIQNRDTRVYIDSHHNLWLFDAHSLAETGWQFSLKTHQWHQLKELAQMGNAMMSAIVENADGRLWIGTINAGLHVFEYRQQKLQRVDEMDVFATHSSHVTCLYLDDNNIMWVGSTKLGVAFTDMSSPSFNLVSTGEYEDVSALMEDGKGNLWIGLDGNGILKKTPTGTTTHYTAVRGQLPSDIVTSLALRADGTLLAGTYGSGILAFDGQRFVQLPLTPASSSLKYIKALLTDPHGNLWVATVDRGIARVTPDGKTVNFTSENSALQSNGVLCLAYDAMRDLVYIGTSVGVSAINASKAQFVQVEALGQLSDAYVSSLMVCNNRLWIGSRNGLWVYSHKDSTVTRLTTDQGMSHNAVRALAMSGDRVWASTDNGLTCISPQTDNRGKTPYKCYPFLDEDGLYGVAFSNNAALTTADGTALLGSFRGYVSIKPGNVMTFYPRPHVRFTDFRINGSVSPGKLSDFVIDYGERPTIFVSAMLPALVRKVKYLYRFKGDKEWVRAPNNSLYFVGLPLGTHVLQVKAELPGLMEETAEGTKPKCQIAELRIKVRPPLWLSTPAILLYVLLLAVWVWLAYRALRMRQKRVLAIKQLEMNLEKYQMEEEKIRFFTNIGHDLKTPLTLVVAPLEKIRQNNLPATVRTELDVAWRNARQLYDLILQLLDFRRLDVGMEKLYLKHGDIAGFLRQTVEGFVYYATRKQINLQMKLPDEPVMVNFDEDKMRRVVTNLLSNAYKYNTDNGSVTVTMNTRDDEERKLMVLSVADTGIGINDKRRVFDRFMQETHGQEQEGSGIGLHIVKQYVGMMGGTISVADNEPRGTVFTVTLPLNDDADDDVEELGTADADTLADDIITDQGVQNKPTILVVEDNTDARLFLQRSLEDEYRVLVAANGKEALQVLAKNDSVSIMVSDVMMPEMDGIELFRQMKGNINYSHIPVILLTAKSSEENIVEGLEEGVADYITKPFSLAVLRLRIRKVLEWTQNVYGQIANGIEIKPSEITVSSLDEELISHVIEHIEANLRNVNYSVAQLSSDVGMTRGHLYKKLMAITGKSPLEFIRIIKLKRGKSLLDQGRTNISEVADMVGLSSKQFTHYFKLTYNDTPTDYLKKAKNHKALMQDARLPS